MCNSFARSLETIATPHRAKQGLGATSRTARAAMLNAVFMADSFSRLHGPNRDSMPFEHGPYTQTTFRQSPLAISAAEQQLERKATAPTIGAVQSAWIRFAQ